ncbi:hypothetical protein KQI84_17520 [bacterium]|nr:hypothetical protein [bacterium]
MADAKANADRIEKRLDETISKLERGQRINTILGIVLIVVIMGYFGWLISKVNDLTTPESVSELVMGMAREQIPDARKGLSEQLTENAEGYINDAFDEVLSSAPDLRREAHKFALQQADKYMKQIRTELESMMDQAIEMHSEEISLLIAELQTVEGTQEFEDTLYQILMAPIQEENVHVDIQAYGVALEELANKMQRLAEAKDLTESERIERDILIALKEFSDRSG